MPPPIFKLVSKRHYLENEGDISQWLRYTSLYANHTRQEAAMLNLPEDQCMLLTAARLAEALRAITEELLTLKARSSIIVINDP